MHTLETHKIRIEMVYHNWNVTDSLCLLIQHTSIVV